VIDPVSTAIAARSALDRGFSRGVVLSVAAHLSLFGVAIGATMLRPRQPVLQVMDGKLIALPPGGGGPSGPPPAPVAPKPAPEQPPAPQPEPPPKVVKPPKEEPKKGLPEPDAKRAKKKPEKTPPSRTSAPASTTARPTTTASSQFPGLDMVGPAGPGVPGGTDPSGDWYLAGVQRKIWMIWTQQIRGDFNQPVTVLFAILADGTLDPDVRVIQSSGVSLLDNAAKRAIYSAAPFAPLPKDYGTNRFTIQATFKPTPTP